MLNEPTLTYVRQHADDDVGTLALSARAPQGVDMPAALRQIAGRQAMRRKVPSWAATDGLVYPPHLNIEQCSSEATARYKADVARRLCPPGHNRLLTDLTGGMGVDCAFMSQAFEHAVYVERSQDLCTIAKHNFGHLGLDIDTVCADARDHLSAMGRASLVYVDPARRDGHGGRVWQMADCQPSVLDMADTLMQKADAVMLKLSPMLDWRLAVAQLGEDCVSQVHMVGTGGECKELLVVMQAQAAPLHVFTAIDDQRFDCQTAAAAAPLPCADPVAGMHVFEPNAAVMKAGCFGHLSAALHVSPVARDSHLFVSHADAPQFPGRRFVIDAVTTLGKRDVRQAFAGVARANITTRNFPLSAEDLRRRLHLADGGSLYVLATTLSDGSRRLLLCRKV